MGEFRADALAMLRGASLLRAFIHMRGDYVGSVLKGFWAIYTGVWPKLAHIASYMFGCGSTVYVAYVGGLLSHRAI